MKKIPNLIREWFSPKFIQDLDVQDILLAMSDATIQKIWISDVFDELQRLNLEVDRRLLTNDQRSITDLAARRKAYQDVLQGVLSARRRIKNPNPKDRSGSFDLDSVTVQSV